MTIKKWLILLTTLVVFVGCAPKAIAPEQGIDLTPAAPADEAENVTGETQESSENALYIFEDFELTALDGTKTNLYAYGGKTIVLNFWTTWCTYCSQMLPYLEVLNQEEDVVVLAVNVGENQKAAQKYMTDKGYTFDVALDEKSNIAAMFGVSGFPTTFFIGPEFEYYLHTPGLLSDVEFEDIMVAIRDFQANQE